MRLITECNDDALFLRTLYGCADDVKKLIDAVGVQEIRKRFPELSGNETEEELNAIKNKQASENLMEMAKGFLMDYPEDTINLLHRLVILEDGEEYPHGFGLLKVLSDILNDKQLLDFFISAARLVPVLGSLA